MKWLRAWFWSGVRDNENWAQTLVRVSGNLFRIALTSIALLVAAIAVTSYLNNRDYEQLQDERRMVSVVASIRTEQNDNGCDEMFPLALLVRNDSSLTLTSMRIELSARQAGTSTNVLPYGQRDIGWDHVVPPGFSMTMCYMPPEAAPANSVISAIPDSYSIVLQPTEQWMLDETSASRSRYQLVP